MLVKTCFNNCENEKTVRPFTTNFFCRAINGLSKETDSKVNKIRLLPFEKVISSSWDVNRKNPNTVSLPILPNFLKARTPLKPQTCVKCLLNFSAEGSRAAKSREGNPQCLRYGACTPALHELLLSGAEKPLFPKKSGGWSQRRGVRVAQHFIGGGEHPPDLEQKKSHP